MMAVRYHRCTCHLRYSNATPSNVDNGHGGGHNSLSWKDNGALEKEDPGDGTAGGGGNGSGSGSGDEIKPQPWYFHVVASVILVVHGFTFLVPQSSEGEDTDMVRTIARWLGYDMEWVKQFTPYAQGLASVFNISLGIVSWWTSKESERYNRLIQLRVFAFCLNILHAYITGPIIYQNDDLPLMAPGRIIGLFRLSYLTPGLMAAGVTEVIVEKEQETTTAATHAITNAGGAKKEIQSDIRSNGSSHKRSENNNQGSSKRDKK
ncbi:hypothetical protein TCAL_01535 [Tigriopus californicus]|uniref:Uncharacterized protein n=1 Tax=Tigriopus californicus TaxID=6832 RepID=A0A553P6Q3_TIGCA|nr:uncharacterized protein LOC131877704 [Tigriopus californicus]TRY73373.1 hypothetical protein TCAL_01535 [Tigriopus californicus]|eukprot:TCALIF_01535-PA protein Name:"Protein of unknown function" AED:0.29 eAED:0.29 QI:250/1/1/1/1/1/3/688/262